MALSTLISALGSNADVTVDTAAVEQTVSESQQTLQNIYDFFFSPKVGGVMTVSGTLLILLCALVMGLIISLGYMFANKKDGYSAYFVTALTVLPAVIAIIIMMIGSNIARAFSLGGVFALIRFRSEPGNPRDITYICITMAAGLACGTGFVGFGFIATVVISAVIIVLQLIGFGKPKTGALLLKVVVPEDIDFQTEFDIVFKKYTKFYKLDVVKTADFGALYQVQYKLALKDPEHKKEFIDEIRAINGNLNVGLFDMAYIEGRKTF